MNIDRPSHKWNSPEKSDKRYPHLSSKFHGKLNKEVPLLRSLNISPRSSKNRSGDYKQKESRIWRLLATPHLPHLLIGYVQLLFNASLAIILLYIIGSFIHTVRLDISSKAAVHRLKLSAEVEACTKAYHENRCHPSTRVPALEAKCREWETCMSRNPRDVAGGRVLAETVADIVNGLLEPIAIKSLVFIAIALFGCVFVSNYAFALARGRYHPSRIESHAPPTLHITTGPGYSPSSNRLTPFHQNCPEIK